MNKLSNLPFLPQKNEEVDRYHIMQMSKEFDPMVSLSLGDRKRGSKATTAVKTKVTEFSALTTKRPEKKEVKSFSTY